MNYRKIYELYYGYIPKDDTGRSFDIHHVDGDRTNNSILNLVALSIQDHYDVHYIQGDYGACLRIAAKMKKTQEELSLLSKIYAQERIKNGTHPFQNSEIQRKNAQKYNGKNLLQGTHPFQRIDFQKQVQKERIKNGTHHFLSKNKLQQKLLSEGRHSSQNQEIKKKMKEYFLERYSLGKHPMQNPKIVSKVVEKNSKEWIISDSNDNVIHVKNLAKFCKENNLSAGSMSQVASGKRKHYKGYTVRKIDETEHK